MIRAEKKFSLAVRIRFIALAGLALVVGGLTLNNYLSQRWLVRQFEQDPEKPVQDGQLIIWKLEVHLEHLEEELLRLAKLEDLKEAFLKKDRGELLEQARPPLNRLRKSPLRLERISFYMPSGTVFLRTHDPDSYGDDVTGHRLLIVKAMKERRIIRGLEAEGNTFFLWAATPLYNKGQLMGILEIGSPVSFFLQEVKSHLGAAVGLFVKNALSTAKLTPVEATDRELVGSVAPLLNFSRELTAPARQVVVVAGHTYAATLIPIKDLSPGQEPVFAILSNVTPLTQLLRGNTRNLIGISAGGFFFAAILIFSLTQKLEKAHRSLEARSAELAAAGERELREAEVRRERMRTEEQIQRNLERLTALREIDMVITSTLSLRTVLDVLLEKIDLMRPGSVATIRLLNHQTGELEPVACRNIDEKEWKAALKSADTTITKALPDITAPVMIRNVQTDPRSLAPDMLRKHGLVSALRVPLIAKGKVLGVLTFLTKEEHEFNKEEVEFLSTIAGQAAVAMQNSQLYEEMVKLAADLSRSNKVKDEFLSVMSHELRTPLNVVMGYVGMIKDGLLGEINPEQEKALEKVLTRARDQLGMINSVLQATLLEAEGVKVESKEFSLREFLEELRSAYDLHLSKELTMEWYYPSDLPVVKTDREKLKQILQNLINNAIKFTEKGGVTISARLIEGSRPQAAEIRQEPSGNTQEEDDLTLASRLRPHAFVEFKVTDTGLGISEEYLPIIFERFRQIDSSETRLYGGVGMGLYIVKKFTELLGGKVEVQSELGKGSTFKVTIPCEIYRLGTSQQGLIAEGGELNA